MHYFLSLNVGFLSSALTYCFMMMQAAEMSQALLELDTAQQQMVIQLGNNARLLKYEYRSVPLCTLRFPADF
jgi:hypothetical protein